MSEKVIVETSAKRNITSAADATKYVLEKLGNISLLTVFRTMLIVINVIVVIFMYNVVTSQQMVEKIIDNVVVSHEEEETNLAIRDHVSPQISTNLRRMLYSLGADRAFVIELHNGKKNATLLPFKYFDMTYEEVNEERAVPYISQNFMNIMVSHYKLPYYLADNSYFVGGCEELSEVDSRFCSNFERFNGKYIAIVIMRNNGKNIGFIGVSYDDGTQIPTNPNEVRQRILSYSRVIAPLLDLGTQKSKIMEEFVDADD